MEPRTDASPKGLTGEHSVVVVNGTLLRQALAWIIDAGIFDHLKLHGNTKWQPVHLVILAVLWVWSDDATLTGAFAEAARWALDLFGVRAVASYQGLTGALVTWTGQLLPLLWQRLHQRLEECGQTHWRIGVWLALAVDGSRVSTPRTVANEQAFCAPHYGKGKTAKYRKKKRQGQRRRARPAEPVKPQIWTTLLWHMGLQLPWCWQTGPANASERDHFRQLLQEQPFPKHTLFVADAGFIGYELWKAITDGGHSFLIRVGANVTLLRQLGYVKEYDGLVYFWPDKAAKKRLPPLVLRLFELQVGRCRMSLLTNVLDDAQLSAEQAVELYRLRWGIELQFRTLKQTFGRRKLRSKTPERALVELDWSLLGLTMIQLYAVKEQLTLGEPPPRRSVAAALGVFRELLDRRHEPVAANSDLGARLRAATVDAYPRRKSKRARYRPGYKDKPAAGSPKLITAQDKHKRFLQQYLAQAA